MTNLYYVMAFHRIDPILIKRAMLMQKYSKYLALSFCKTFTIYRTAYQWMQHTKQQMKPKAAPHFYVVKHDSKLYKHYLELKHDSRLLTFSNFANYLFSTVDFSLHIIHRICKHWRILNAEEFRHYNSLDITMDSTRSRLINDRELDSDIPKSKLYVPRKSPFVSLKQLSERDHQRHTKNVKPSYAKSMKQSYASAISAIKHHHVNSVPESATDSGPVHSHSKGLLAKIDNNSTLTSMTNSLNKAVNNLVDGTKYFFHDSHAGIVSLTKRIKKLAHKFSLAFISRDLTAAAEKFQHCVKLFGHEFMNMLKDLMR